MYLPIRPPAQPERDVPPLAPPPRRRAVCPRPLLLGTGVKAAPDGAGEGPLRGVVWPEALEAEGVPPLGPDGVAVGPPPVDVDFLRCFLFLAA